MNKPDHMHAPIAHLLEALVLECPVCAEPAEAHRFMGIGAGRGMRWIVFLPHLAPCRRVCAAGHAGPKEPGKVHTGPRSCERCASGHEDAPTGDLVLIDETGDLASERVELEWGDDDDDNELDAILRG